MEHVEAFIRAGTYLRNWSPRTVTTYRQAFASLQQCLRESGGVPVEGPLTKARLEAWVAWLRKRGVTPGGVNMYARTVNSYLSWKHAEGLAPERLRIRLLPDPKKPVSLMSPGELRLLSIHRPKDWYGQRTRALALLMCDTGVRIAEALSLEAAKVSWDGLHMEVMGKGRRPRQVPFSEGLRRAVWPLEQRRLRRRPDCPWLFHSDSGRQLSYHNAYRDLKAVCADAGVRTRVHPHAFRHLFAITYVRNGGDLYRLSRILGHQSLSTTQTYLRSMGLEHLKEGHSRLTPLAGL